MRRAMKTDLDRARALWRALVTSLGAMPVRDGERLAREVRRDLDAVWPAEKASR